MRVLSQRELNRALLARQHLLERATGPIPRLLERMGALQAQYAPSMYIGLASRLEGFTRGDLDRALERRAVVQGTLMRITIHLASRRDYWPFALGTREARRARFLGMAQSAGLTPRDMAAAARRVKARLAGGATLRAPEMAALVGKPTALGVGLWLDMVRVPPSGTWARRRADLYGLAEDWIGPPDATADEGIELLVRRYLTAFGPAAPAEVADWAGLPLQAVAPVLELLPLRRFRTEAGGELVDLPRLPIPDPETPAPPRLLPTWDAALLVHARRTGLLPEATRKRIFGIKTPHSFPTFLVDGVVAGTWRHDRGRFELDPFSRLDAATRRALREEGERMLAALYL